MLYLQVASVPDLLDGEFQQMVHKVSKYNPVVDSVDQITLNHTL